MAMQEGRRSRGEEEEEDHAMTTFVCAELPKEVQHKVLSCLPVQELCQVRCVCKDWRDAIHRREFRAMYDAVHRAQGASPVICYMESSYPVRLEWSAYDYAARTWKRMNSFPSLPQSILTPHSVRHHYSLSSVGGLLCLYFWKQQERASRSNVRLAPPGVSSWTIWHPFRNRWKRLPASKHRAPVFVHAFVSDAQAKTYKLLVAHNPKSHRYYFDEDIDPDPRLLTEVYDSATGAWSELAEHSLGSAHGLRTYLQGGLIRRGVLAHGAVHFLTEDALLSYDVKANQWDEERFATRYPIFEWDGRLMSITSRDAEADELNRVATSYWLVERDFGTRRWEDTGIEIPWSKILSKFRDVESLAIVASGNHLALTGCAADGGLKIAVYKRAENYWRLPPTGAFSDKMERSRVEGVVLHTPLLDWRP